MADYKIGFGKPPKGRPFEPGKSGNPRGRPPRAANQLGKIVREVLDGHMTFREKGRTRTASRREVSIKLLVERAVKGDIAAADLLLKKRAHALKQGQTSTRRLTVVNWLPEYPGQTGEQKARGLDHQLPDSPQKQDGIEAVERSPDSEAASKPPQDTRA